MFGLFKFVDDLVGNIISQILQQVRIIEDAVTAPLRALVQQVVGGIWKGDGATRFVNEMTSEVIPMLVNIMNVNNGYADALKKAQDRMNQAGRQAASQAQSLFDVFSQIF
ncbi:MAG: WXG100 family type VII secretion target [Anaerolineales bacterium]|nr:WXG100 family type VII secretion target [Anaerolineales bacterium]MCX7754216.1 WXG100 family type VII secretion target [Anaerolineales bacterium]MDW8276934.1 WXG100 family type VII secretion target [Anaerolineales bacterium]